ncbi:uncharacterized membrane protein YheB (UPF0754 family) [Litorivivens lipolytica]|uniref:Uncharacterized membrane protein YheB (UPF0754 family) n=1 Tax=Litorivivens lipolytica TaxID=1524264 RepID=A0A7W4Z5H8_9GAMM|nr:hypothetical protein [Litorivivens lipolytica]MBB3045830.1 uncharacterized membrane protein YheB (UPF0754 family) [Litorivivens lipolytica]
MEAYSHYIPYILIPVITAFIGWFTNLIGIKMILYPVRWTGIGSFIGWQGIVPRMRVRLTKQLVKNSISVICTEREMLAALDEADAIGYISHMVSPQIEEWVDDIMEEHTTLYWELSPKPMRAMVYRKVREQLPELSREILEEVAQNADRFINIEEIAAKEAEKNPEIVTNLVTEMAGYELKLIILSGLFLGFPLGIAQALTWYYFPNAWVLPLFGVLVGAGTNWIALQIIFKPGEPVNILGYKLQGIFIKRQQVVSAQFAESFTSQFLDVRGLFDYIWQGENSDEVHRLVRRKIRKVMDKNRFSSTFDKLMRISGQKTEFDAMTISLVQDRLMRTLDQPKVTRKLLEPINNLIARRLSALSPQQFQGLLMPIFESEQWIVILVGGFLGGAAGTAQLVYLFGGSFLGFGQ